LKIGVFGGTFNPIHMGHLISAQIVLEQHQLDRILFIPSRQPVHKEEPGGVSAEDRFTMIRLAIEGNPAFEASRVEIDRAEPSFTIITVKLLLDSNPGSDLYLILGADAFSEIDTWKDYRELLGLITLIVLTRTGPLHHDEGIVSRSRKVLFASNPVIGISSSCVRERVRNGRPISSMVPRGVDEYIREKGLYRNWKKGE
jgi:nicotinate-nucleotide adenylyltransferase